jgi:hypothetical protein
MKKTTVLASIFALTLTIVLPVIRNVNISGSNHGSANSTLSADGWPLPFPVPTGGGPTFLPVNS